MKTSSLPVTALTLSVLLLSACASPSGSPAASPDPEPDPRPAVQEQPSASPRLVVTHEGGLTVLDTESLESVAEIPLEGFLRLSDAGDGRHLAVSAAGGFHLLDTGSWSEAHGDHAHHYTAEPALTGGLLQADKPGHVVAGAGRTAFFDDASGEVTLVNTGQLAGSVLDAEQIQLPAAHHGVAVPLGGDSLIVSRGSDEGRTGAAVLDRDGAEILRSDECPGLHGEAGAAGAIVFGCDDGMLVYREGKFSKVASPDGYGRMGNQAGSPKSPVILADYKTDPGADLERPETVALVDTASGGLRLVDLGTSYTFRSLGRGDAGEAVVLGTDGALHVIDPGSGAVVSRIQVIDPWEEPVDWQEPRPALQMAGGTAYVTDPVGSRVLAVDLESGAVLHSAALPAAPNEILAAQ